MPILRKCEDIIMDDASEDGDNTCPLCMEEMDSTDRQLKPCRCDYQICVWCWNHIMEMAEKDSTEGRCPACRTPYDKEKIVATTVSCDRLTDFSNDKKQKSSKAKAKATEGRKNLSNVRVIQRNLVYVVGVPANLADEETLERKEYFGQYGKILKISVSKSSSHSSQHSTTTSTASVYVTYVKEEDALRCIQAVNGYILEGKVLKACFGTTKYCNAWLKHMPCNNPDCLYLHDEGTREDSFTKEEMLAKYGSKNQHFHDLTHPAQRRSGVGLPPPIIDVSSVSSTSHAVTQPGSATKPSLSNGSFGKPSSLPAAASWGSRAMTATVRSAPGRNCAGSASTKLKLGTSPVLSAASGHTTSSAMFPASLATSAAGGAGVAFGISSEPCISTSIVLGNHAVSATGQVLQASSMKQNGVKSMKANVADVTRNMSFSASVCASIPASFLEVTDPESVTSTPNLQSEVSSSEMDTKTASFMDSLEAQEKDEVNGHGFHGSHSSLSSAEEITGLDGPTRCADNLKFNEPRSTVCPMMPTDDRGKSVADVFDEKECSGTSPPHDSFGMNNLNLVGASNVSSCGIPPVSKDATESLAQREILMIDGLTLSGFDSSDRPARNGQSSIAITSASTLNCSSGNVLEDCLLQESQSITETSDTQTQLRGQSKMNMLKEPSDPSLDSIHPTSLSVGGLSIHLNADISSSMQDVPGESKDSAQSNLSLKDPWAHVSSSYSLESLDSSVNQELSPLTADDTRSKLSREGSSGFGNRLGKGASNGYWEASERGPTESTGETEIISDMLAMGFDIWADGSPQDFSHLLFSGKHVESPAPSGVTSSLKETSTPWKSSSSKQSRFHFARREDSTHESSLSSSRSTSWSDCLTPTLSLECGSDRQMLAERYNLDLHSSSFGRLNEAVSDIMPSPPVSDKFLNAANSTCSGTSADSVVIPSTLSSKSSISAPPGFSLSTRVSSVSPPGFSLQSRVDRPPDSRTTSEARQASEPLRSVPTAGIYSPLEVISSSNDVEFIDPAIMAVGRGKVPVGMVQNAPFSPMSGFFSQAPSNSSLSVGLGLTTPMQQQPRRLDFDSSFQMQQRNFYGSLSSMNSPPPLGFTNQEADASLPSLFPSFSDAMNSSRLLGQYQDFLNSTVSHVGMQDPACSNSVPKFRFQQSSGSAWDNWNRLSSSMETNSGGQRLLNDAVGHMNISQTSLDRVFHSRLEDLAMNKEIGSKYFGEAVSLSGQDDQGPFSNARMTRYFLQN